MMKCRALAAALPLLLLTGCLCSSYRDTAYFDLSPSPRNGSAPLVRVAELRNSSGAGSRFQYRERDGRIVSDPDRKWIMPPGALVARALRTALSGSGRIDGKGALVSGELLFFETDRTAGKFRLCADMSIESGDRRKTVRIDVSAPVADDSPEAVVRAADLAVNEMAKRLSQAL